MEYNKQIQQVLFTRMPLIRNAKSVLTDFCYYVIIL